jgi:hypothetical protein
LPNKEYSDTTNLLAAIEEIVFSPAWPAHSLDAPEGSPRWRARQNASAPGFYGLYKNPQKL